MSPTDQSDSDLSLEMALAEPNRQNLLQSVRSFGKREKRDAGSPAVGAAATEKLAERICRGEVRSMRHIFKALGLGEKAKAGASDALQVSSLGSISAATLRRMDFTEEESAKVLELSRLVEVSRKKEGREKKSRSSDLPKLDISEGMTEECEVAPVTIAEFENASESGQSFPATPVGVTSVKAEFVTTTPTDAIEVKPILVVAEEDSDGVQVEVKGEKKMLRGIQECSPSSEFAPSVVLGKVALDTSFASARDLEMGVPVHTDPQSPSFESSKPYIFKHRVYLNPPPDEVKSGMLNGKLKRVDGLLVQTLGEWSNNDPLWDLLRRHQQSDDVQVSFLSLPKDYGKNASEPPQHDPL